MDTGRGGGKLGHTPTPWMMWAEKTTVDIYEKKSFGKGLFVGAVSFAHKEEAQTCADAAFIVKAVNSHDALVEALKEAHELLDYIADKIGVTTPKDNIYTVIQDAKDALKLAGEEV